jgi:calcineurin-like phosphoesterase family protein
MDRRSFLRNTSLTTIAIATHPKSQAISPITSKKEKFSKLRIGICADLHQDIMHDSPKRIEAFINDMQVEQPDLIIQMGDFCRPVESNRIILDIWNRFQGPRYHVIGNHDMDGGFDRDQVVSFWKSVGKYYSFDLNGYHFVVLDGNEPNPYKKGGGYPRFITNEQLHWLEADLEKTSLPTLVFCHQGLDNDIAGIENATKCRLVLERANKEMRKVQLVFSGHHHQDYHNEINGIHYVQINSMSYYWIGENHPMIRYSKEIDKEHPAIKYTVPYKDPLWGVIDINKDGKFRLKGRKSVFVGPSPEEMGGKAIYDMGYEASSFISDREIQLTLKKFEFANP